MATNTDLALNLVNSLVPQKPKKTVTKQDSGVTQEGVDYQAQKLLEGNSGLRNISGAQAGAGIYNSTAATKLANDLTAEIAGKSALLSATPTTTVTEIAPQANPAATALGILAPSLGEITANAGGGLGGLVGGLDTAASTLFDAGAAGINSLLGTSLTGTGAGGSLLGSIGSGISSLGSSIASSLGFGGAAAGAGASAAGAAAPGLFGGAQGLLGSLGSGLSGVASFLGPIGLVAGLISLFGGGDISIICTELHKQGKLTDKEYARNYAASKRYGHTHRVGYYSFAPAVVKRIKAKPNGLEVALWTKFFSARTRNTLRGKALTAIFAFGCKQLGKWQLRHNQNYVWGI